jgi:type I restriction enzyme S subunit
MNKIGSAGKVYLMPEITMPASLGRNAFMFRYDDRINAKYLFHLLTSKYGQREIQQYVRGAVTKTITKNDARAVLIIVPPIELQSEFVDFVAQVDKSKFTNINIIQEGGFCNGDKFYISGIKKRI